MSGHSKWANIKHKKESTDKKRGILFTKMTKELMVAARIGGSDPSSNNRLRIAISKARAVNVPRDTIERAIKKGSGELEGQTFEDLTYEIYAQGGVGIIVEALTDKKTRTTPEIKSSVTKMGANLAETNAVTRLFQKRGYITVEKNSINEEELMELVIEAGAEDVVSGDEYIEIFTLPEDYSSVAEALSVKEISISQSGIQYLPLEGTEITVSDVEMAKKNLKLIDILEEHDDVQAIYHNMQIDDDIVDSLDI
ncbi:MAG: YebC/PmpR family DNA-binding transcriptional regulator [Spirochaetia bacterium]|nr:YebC/PmpR family DNA-binding transcriptional regulator [Spirochaetia bacterium]